MFDAMQYKVNTVPGYPMGAVFHAIYDRANPKTIHTLRGEISRARYAVRAAQRNLSTHITSDRKFEHGLYFWLNRHDEALWTETLIGSFNTREEANAAAIDLDEDLEHLGVKQIRRKAYCGSLSKTGGLKRPSKWGDDYQATQAKLKSFVSRIIEPISLSDDDEQELQRYMYYAFSPNNSLLLTRGDIYLEVCSYLGIAPY